MYHVRGSFVSSGREKGDRNFGKLSIPNVGAVAYRCTKF